MLATLTHSLYSWLNGKQQAEEDEEDPIEQVERELEQYEEEEQRTNVKCKVTGLNRVEGYALLNNSHFLDLHVCSGITLKVGNEVIVDLKKKGDMWHATAARVPPHAEEEASSKDNALHAKITNIANGVALLNGNQSINLKDLLDQEFTFAAGDWVKIKYENGKMVYIQALRRMTFTGKVTSMIGSEGVVDNTIWFHMRNLHQNGYQPNQGDEVVCEAIESSQGPLEWRAISLVLKTAGPRTQSRGQKTFALILTKEHKELMQTKENMKIKINLSFNKMMLNDTKTINCYIVNEGNKPQELMSIQQPAALVADMFVVDPPFTSYPHILEPGSRVVVHITCHANNLGRHQQLIIFDFGTFQIGRFAKVEVEDPNLDFLKGSPYQRRVVSLDRLNICEQADIVVPGVRRRFPRGGRNTQSNYMKMGIYPLPPFLYQQIREKKDLLKLYPVLGEIICPQNYTQKFDMLLHLEEIQLCVDLQQFNLHDACLQHAGQFLSLELPGLAEGRPSLLVGDRALLTLPGSMEAEDKLTVYEGCIHEVHKDSIRLMFHPDFHAKYNGESYDISFEFNRNQIRKCHYTITHVQQLKHLLFPPLSMDLKPPVFTLHEWFNPHLNQRQKDAVLRILENQSHLSPYVVFGPPGTGKTLTLVETVVQITHTMPHARVLVCAPSNSAADLIAMKLIKTNGFDGSDIVRLNAFQRKEESIMEGLETYCKVGQDLSMLVRQRLVVTTCTNAGLLYRMQLPESHFSHILIDEAGQATEPETLIPILLSLSAQVVLAGDHKQLGPIVRSFVARNSGLQLSLMERIMTRHCYQPDPDHYAETGNYNPYLVTKLIDNYRSVPDLVEMPSRMFYDNQLVCHYTGGEEFQKLSQSKIFPTPGFPIVFHGVQGEELRESDSPSWFNPIEIVQASQYLSDLYNEGLTPGDVGIITPYRKQVEKLRRFFTMMSIPPCKVGSVEEFQGQERIAIIVSTVRTQSSNLTFEQNIGFLSQPKRFNVTVTRAKHALIVVGDPNLLSKDENWGTFLQHVIQKGGYRGCQMSQD